MRSSTARMQVAGRVVAAVVVLLALGVLLAVGRGVPSAGAGDAPPAPDPAAALARATELDAEVREHYRRGRYEDAAASARESLSLRERTAGCDPADLARSLDALGLVLVAQAAHGEAKPLLQRALAIREKALGGDHVDVAASLNNLAELLRAQGAPAEARPLHERALAIREKALGRDHVDVATSLNNLAELLRESGAHAEARPLYERALAILEAAHGPDHPDVATALQNLGLLFDDMGQLAPARDHYARALAIREKALGPDHPDVATTLGNLGGLLEGHGAVAEARPMYERALSIREKALGPDHPAVATSLDDLAGLLAHVGAYGDAQPLYERALGIRRRSLGEGHPDVATALHNLATLRRSQGAYADALRHAERAVAIWERAWGPDHLDVATGLNLQVLILQDLGRYAQVRPLAERALGIREKVLGKDHPSVATSLNNLALLLQAQGAHADARALHERALGIWERARGRDHPDVATSLNNLAELLRAQGAYEEARPLYERVLAILERALGPEHATVAASLHNLATLLRAQGAVSEARPHAERALGIWEKALGGEHPRVAMALHSVAEIARAQGDAAAARKGYERSLAIREKALGPDHPAVAATLNGLAGLLRAQGAHAEARALYERAIELRERAFGPHDPELALLLGNLAVLLQAQGAVEDAQRAHERALAIDEAGVRTRLAALSATQRLALVRSVRSRLDHWLQFAPKAGRSGHAEALRFRGIVTRGEAAERALARRADGPQRQAYEALEAANRVVARLANQLPGRGRPEAHAAWQARYAEAAAERERLTRLLTSQVAAARTALERIDLTSADVQRSLAADAVLVDMLRVGGAYVAWVLRPHGEAARVELGAADAVDAACEAFREALTDDAGDGRSRDAIAAAGRALRGLVWSPLEPHLGAAARRVVLCPDAALASVPFAALPGASPGTWLGDERVFSCVYHPFDLVPRGVEARGAGALVVGGVDYDRADLEPTEAGGTRAQASVALDRAPRAGTFSPIPATRTEADGLRARFAASGTTLLVEAAATEARVRSAVRGKRWVHVATHGFARTDLLAGLYDRKVQDAFLAADAERQLAVGHDPMLLCGLALAGANPRDGGGGDDGILTALEASYLDLDGVELVTLSACDTARGTAASGEGVLGLVAAFQMAGASRVLASLWKVDDEATRWLMDAVYERLLRPTSPLSPAAALSEAAAALRTRTDPAGRRPFAAPRYWAAFVAYGG